MQKLSTLTVELAIITLILISLWWVAVRTHKTEAFHPDQTWNVD